LPCDARREDGQQEALEARARFFCFIRAVGRPDADAKKGGGERALASRGARAAAPRGRARSRARSRARFERRPAMTGARAIARERASPRGSRRATRDRASDRAARESHAASETPTRDRNPAAAIANKFPRPRARGGSGRGRTHVIDVRDDGHVTDVVLLVHLATELIDGELRGDEAEDECDGVSEGG